MNNIIRSELPWPGNFVSQERNFPGFIDPLSFDGQLDSLVTKNKASPSLVEFDPKRDAKRLTQILELLKG